MKFVDGTEKCPNSHQDSINAWKEQDAAARFCLVSTVGSSSLKSLLGCKTSTEMWTRLKIQYQPNDNYSKHDLLCRFHGFNYQRGSSMIDHISALESIAVELREAGEVFTEERLVYKIVESLTDKFEAFRSSWEMRTDSI